MSDSYTSIWCTCTENSTDIANNTSNVTVNLICSTSGYANDNPDYWLKVNGTVVRSGTRNFSSGQTFTLATWTGDIAHNSDGTGSLTYQGYFQGTAKPDPGNTTQVYTKTLTTLARESKFGSVSDFNFESSFSFPVTKNIADATDTLVISSGTFSKTITPYVSNQSITLTSTEKTQLYNLNTTGTTVPLTLTLTTVYNSSTVGSDTKQVNGTFVAEAPTASGTINTSPSTIYEGVTTLRVTLNSITFSLKKSATVVQYSVTVDGKTVTGTSTSSSTYYDFPNLTSGSKTISVQVLDSRGMSLATPVTKSITVTAYTPPTITSVSITRYPGPTGTEARMTIIGTYDASFNTNPETDLTITIEQYYDNQWQSIEEDTVEYYTEEYNATFSTSNGVFTLSNIELLEYGGGYTTYFAPTQSYLYRAAVFDIYLSSYVEATLGSIKTTLDIDTINQRVGVGKFIENEDNLSLTVAGDIYEGGTKLGNKYAGYEVVSSTPSSADYSAFFNLIYPVGSIYLSINSTNPSTLFGGTWVQIKDAFLLSAGDTYSANTRGGSATHYHEVGIRLNGYYYSTNWEQATSGLIDLQAGTDTLGTSTKPGVQDAVTVNSGAAAGGKSVNADRVIKKGTTSTGNNLPPYYVVYMWRRTA